MNRRYGYYKFSHSYCICGGKAIFQYDFKRRKKFVQQEDITVNVYKCATCGKLWQQIVEESTNK